MNWLMFFLAAWVMLGLEVGLRSLLQLGPHPLVPSFVMILLTFVCTFAPPRTARWACLTLGLLVDLTNTIELREIGATIVLAGPYALSYLLAGQFVLTIRGVMMRRSPLTIAFLAMVGSAVAGSLLTTILTVRWAYGDPLLLSPTRELVTRLGAAFYTGLAALPVSLVLLPLSRFFGFQASPPRRLTRT